MAVLPKKYGKKGPMSPEDYIVYMGEKIEVWARVMEKRVRALEDRCAELEKENKALKEKMNG